jgi:hypothetical protein
LRFNLYPTTFAPRGLRRLDRRECPGSVEHFRPWPVEAHDVVPAVHEGEAVGTAIAASAEMDRDRTIVVRVAVMLLTVYALRSFGSKYPSAL